MSVAAITTANVAAIGAPSLKFRDPLQTLTREIVAGNISNAQDALQQFTQQLNTAEVKKNDSEEGTSAKNSDAIQGNVRTLRNALFAGDIETARSTVTQLGSIIQAQSKQPVPREENFLEHTAQVRTASQENAQATLQATISLEAQLHTLDVYA